MERSCLPNFLYHITCKSNMESIIEKGLGAVKGKGIDWKNGQQGVTYFIDFNPNLFLSREYNQSSETNLTQDQEEMVLLLVGLLMNRKNFIAVSVVKVSTNDLDITRLRIDPADAYVYVYNGVIKNFTYKCYEVSTKGRTNEFEFLGDEIYSRRIDCEADTDDEIEECGEEPEEEEPEDEAIELGMEIERGAEEQEQEMEEREREEREREELEREELERRELELGAEREDDESTSSTSSTDSSSETETTDETEQM
jgi:hypothetical protein